MNGESGCSVECVKPVGEVSAEADDGKTHITTRHNDDLALCGAWIPTHEYPWLAPGEDENLCPDCAAIEMQHLFARQP